MTELQSRVEVRKDADHPDMPAFPLRLQILYRNRDAESLLLQIIDIRRLVAYAPRQQLRFVAPLWGGQLSPPAC